jgi:DNA polymerase-3 subunit alpha
MKSQKIIKVKKIGVKPTVDIEVDSDSHLFYGNGIATSNSHSVSYAINAYLSAYTKAHFSKMFFASYLRFAKDKIDPQEEIKALVHNAHEMDITIRIPDIRLMNEHFILHNNQIYFGLTDIKGVGQSVFTKLKKISNNIENMSWIEIVSKILININSTAAKALIESGALSFLTKSRNSMLFELSIVSQLTKKELDFLTNNITDNKKSLKNYLEIILTKNKLNKNRQKIINDLMYMLDNPPYCLEDSPEWIADVEDMNLGCSITCSKVDMYDISMTNINCKDLKNTTIVENLILGGEIDYLSITKTKTGQNPGQEMAFITLTDGTGIAESVVFFPEKYKEYKNILFTGNVIIVKGKKTKNRDGLIVEKAYIPKT